MDLGQQLRHRQALAPLISFLLVTPSRIGLKAHKVSLASVWVFSIALRIFKYWLIIIEQTAHNFEVSTSVSALEISDLPPVSIPAAGPNFAVLFCLPGVPIRTDQNCSELLRIWSELLRTDQNCSESDQNWSEPLRITQNNSYFKNLYY